VAHYQDVQKGDVRHTSADMTRAREMLGYYPKVTMDEGLQKEFEWVSDLIGLK
jgi:UDP-glucose 4-epimerase